MAEATTTAPPAKQRRKLPEVQKIFESKAELDKGQAHAKANQHTYDTRKFLVTSADGKVKKHVLAYSPANAVGMVWEHLGVKVEELDPSERQPFQPTKQTVKNAISKLSEEDRKAILAEIAGDSKKK